LIQLLKLKISVNCPTTFFQLKHLVAFFFPLKALFHTSFIELTNFVWLDFSMIPAVPLVFQ